jgi:hypothetical protein
MTEPAASKTEQPRAGWRFRLGVIILIFGWFSPLLIPNLIKERFFMFLKKHGPPDRVSLARYRIGLVMFVLPVLFGWLGPYGAHLIPGYETHRFVVSLIGDVMFIASLFVLGGDFWDKVRALFTYNARAQIPAKNLT